MPHLLTTRSAAPLDTDGYLEAVKDAAWSACGQAQSHNIQLAGQPARLHFASSSLKSQFLRALRHVEVPCASNDALQVTIWSSTDQQLLLDHSPWSARQYWDRDEVLSVRHEHGYAAYDPQSGTISLYDRRSKSAAFWISNENRIPGWVAGAPLLNLMNWWLADNNLAICHAAAIGFPNAAALVIGRGGSGKSTTAIASLASPLCYLSDDYAVVSVSDTPHVYSIYNSGKLFRSQLDRQFPDINQQGVRSTCAMGEKTVVFFAETHPAKLLLQARLKAILVPQIDPRPEPAMESMSAGETIRAFAPSTILQLAGNQRQKLAMLSALTRTLSAYRIRLCPDHAKNVKLIQSLLEE